MTQSLRRSWLLMAASLLTVGLLQCLVEVQSLPEPGNEPTLLEKMSPLEAPIFDMLLKITDEDPEARQIKTLMTDHEWEKEYTPGLSTVDVLSNCGFKYETHECVSLDGYVTQLVRLINPHVDRRHLRKNPVVLFTGQGVSPAAFLATSSKSSRQPLEWAPSLGSDDKLFAEDRDKMGEANRSLAVMLSNNGFDVWLVPTRGVDAQNRRRQDAPNPAPYKAPASVDGAVASKAGFLSLDVASRMLAFTRSSQSLTDDPPDLVAKLRKFAKKLAAKNYWSFSNDEIIEFEFEGQLEKVRSVSGAEKISIVSYSNGGFILFGFLARNPAYAQQHLDAVVNLAPAVFVNKLNAVLAFAGFASNLNPPVWPFPQDPVDALARHGVEHLCRSKTMRYSVCKTLLNKLYGESDLFHTQLDMAIFDYIGRPVSVNSLQQTLQVANDGKMRRFDHGLIGNFIFYGQTEPESYALHSITHERLYVFSGSSDEIADSNSLTHLMGSIGSKPELWTRIPNYNHLDLLVACDNAEQVNLPVLKILIDRDIEVDYYSEKLSYDNSENSTSSYTENSSHSTSSHYESSKEGLDVVAGGGVLDVNYEKDKQDEVSVRHDEEYGLPSPETHSERPHEDNYPQEQQGHHEEHPPERGLEPEHELESRREPGSKREPESKYELEPEPGSRAKVEHEPEAEQIQDHHEPNHQDGDHTGLEQYGRPEESHADKEHLEQVSGPQPRQQHEQGLEVSLNTQQEQGHQDAAQANSPDNDHEQVEQSRDEPVFTEERAAASHKSLRPSTTAADDQLVEATTEVPPRTPPSLATLTEPALTDEASSTQNQLQPSLANLLGVPRCRVAPISQPIDQLSPNNSTNF